MKGKFCEVLCLGTELRCMRGPSCTCHAEEIASQMQKSLFWVQLLEHRQSHLHSCLSLMYFGLGHVAESWLCQLRCGHPLLCLCRAKPLQVGFAVGFYKLAFKVASASAQQRPQDEYNQWRASATE